MRTLTHPSSFARHAQVRLGRRLPRRRYGLPFATYAQGAQVTLPTPPATADYRGAALPALQDVMLNDQLGDCVIAGYYHVVGVETGNAGALFHATNAQVLADYEAIAGYVPGDASTDNGTDLPTALSYWTHTGGANGTKLLASLAVDPSSQEHVQLATFLFENAYLGMSLPDAWVSPFPEGDGFVWDVAGSPNPENGHCVMATGYTPDGLDIVSWGMRGTLTWAALATYAASKHGGELYALVTPDQLAKGAAKAPNGFLWTDLLADANALGAHVPVPAPAPAPAPTPAGNVLTRTHLETLLRTQWGGRAVLTEAEVIALIQKVWPS